MSHRGSRLNTTRAQSVGYAVTLGARPPSADLSRVPRLRAGVAVQAVFGRSHHPGAGAARQGSAPKSASRETRAPCLGRAPRRGCARPQSALCPARDPPLRGPRAGARLICARPRCRCVRGRTWARRYRGPGAAAGHRRPLLRRGHGRWPQLAARAPGRYHAQQERGRCGGVREGRTLSAVKCTALSAPRS